MCQFFSAIVFKSGDIRFCESNEHETLIGRLHLDDMVDLFLRTWVRVECQGDDYVDVNVDESSTPSWVDADRDEFNGPEDSLALYRTLPNAEILVVPRADHVGLVRHPLVMEALRDFYTRAPR